MTRIICVASVVYFKIRFFLKYTIMKTATFLLQQVYRFCLAELS
ncbi:hypothetical protein [Wolbachia pipientis]|nr:hypothetical protein [Wolbachia pipientis]